MYDKLDIYKIFLIYQKLLDAEHDLRDKIRVICKDTERISRDIGMVMQKIHIKEESIAPACEEAKAMFIQAREGYHKLSKVVPKIEYYKFYDHWRFMTQNYCYYITLTNFLKTGELATHEDVAEVLGVEASIQAEGFHVDFEDYLYGLLNLCFELVRLAVNFAATGVYDRTRQIATFVLKINTGFRLLNLRNDTLRKRYDSLKYETKRLEELVLEVRHLEMLKNLPAQAVQAAQAVLAAQAAQMAKAVPAAQAVLAAHAAQTAQALLVAQAAQTAQAVLASQATLVGQAAQVVQAVLVDEAAPVDPVAEAAPGAQTVLVAQAAPVAQTALVALAAPVVQAAQTPTPVQPAPVASAAPVVQVGPVAQVDPADQVAPVAQEAPMAQTALVAQVVQEVPVAQSGSLAPMVEAVMVGQADQAAPVAQADQAAQVAPVAQAAEVAQVDPVAQAVSVAEVEQVALVAQVVLVAHGDNDIPGHTKVPGDREMNEDT